MFFFSLFLLFCIQSKLAGAMTKLNPFRSANKVRKGFVFCFFLYCLAFSLRCQKVTISVVSLQNEKLADLDDEDPPASSEKSSGNKQVL